MNLKQLEYFTAIVREGSISAAARALHISQPPLSLQMKLLEEELGVTLFERGARSILLTEAGAHFFRRTSNILDLTNALRQEMRQLGHGLNGLLLLGMISSSQSPALIRHLSEFQALHPEVSFRISEGNTYQLLERLDHGAIEAAVVRTPYSDHLYEALTLNQEPMAAVGLSHLFPPTLPAQAALSDLSSCPLIVYRRWESAVSSCLSPHVPRYICVNDDARTSLTWARCGAGIAIVPASVAAGCQDEAHMRLIHLSDRSLASSLTLVCRKNSASSAIVTEFFRFTASHPILPGAPPAKR